MKEKLVFVADLGLFKFYRLTDDPLVSPHLELISEKVMEEAHHRLVDQVSDMAGRYSSPTQKKWGAPMSDGSHLELETRRRLIKRLAQTIEQYASNHSNNGCWLAAPREINQLLCAELSPATRNRIEKNVPLDLTKIEPKSLLERFRQ